MTLFAIHVTERNVNLGVGRWIQTALGLSWLLGTACIYTADVKPRPAAWAQPIESAALSNLYEVSPELYRCALPDHQGYAAANEMGIKTVVNLRAVMGAEKPPAGMTMDYLNIPFQSGAPSYAQARQFFEVVDDPGKTPVLLHCYHGADRTGAFIALYRINRQGWSHDEAIREMTGGGYHFHTMWKSMIEWVREAPEF